MGDRDEGVTIALVVILAVLAFGAVFHFTVGKRACDAKGGQYVRAAWSFVCIRGEVIE